MKYLKILMLILILILLCDMFLCYWCYSLEHNYQVLYQELNNYKNQTIEKNKFQDKEIRILKQDVLILEKGWDES